MTRKAISEPMDQAAPASTDPIMNTSRAVSQTRLAPNRSAAHPVSGITVAKASMYPVSTHWTAGIDARKVAPTVGIATLTIVRSRTVMIVPRMTTAARVRISRLKPSPRPSVPAVAAAVLVSAIVASQR
jgi:hypothetical protein